MNKLPSSAFFLFVAAILAFAVVTDGFYTVDAGEQAVVRRFGAISTITGPGFHLKLPFAETINKISTRITAREWVGNNAMEAYSKDQQVAHLSVKISYRALSDAASITKLYNSFGDLDSFAGSILVPRVLEGVKTTFGQFNAVTAIQERARLNSEVESVVRSLVKGPIAIEGVQIQDIAFSDAYEQSIEQRMQAQVEVEKVMQNKAREQLQADIRVIQATAEAQSLKLKGDAEASAIEARGKALRDNPQLVGLVAAEKWNGILPTTMVPGSATPFIQMPPTK